MFTVASWLFGVVVAAIAGYLLLLTLCSARGKAMPAAARRTRFAMVVPAHDEEPSIAATVQSLLGVDYPAELRTVVVVADNCSDRTAAVARSAGARVIERQNKELRGKGYALELAFETLLGEGQVDAIVVVDADTTVSSQLLSAFDARLAAGAGACQGRYGVRNVHASWRTKLMAIALGAFHDLRSLARERLGLSCGLRGNGMAFSAATLRAHPNRAYGLVEDVEYAVHLGLVGVRVHYVHEAEVLGEMASSGKTAASQRQRWEGGRAVVMQKHLGPLLARGLRGDRVALELGFDLLTPPLSKIVLVVAAGFVLEAVAWLCGYGPTSAIWLWLGSALAVVLYVLRGAMLSGLGWEAFKVLLAAPGYVVWKMLRVARGPANTWVRTEREGQPS